MHELRVLVVDDVPMHRRVLIKTMHESTAHEHQFNFSFRVLGEFNDGESFLSNLAQYECDLITLDIRMPRLDGLTTLLKLRRMHQSHVPVCMVSSESIHTMNTESTSSVLAQAQTMTFEQKMKTIQKVEERVLLNERLPGKINDLLTACEKLGLDPIHYAEHLGANGYLCKPFTVEAFNRVIPESINGKFMISKVHNSLPG